MNLKALLPSGSTVDYTFTPGADDLAYTVSTEIIVPIVLTSGTWPGSFTAGQQFTFIIPLMFPTAKFESSLKTTTRGTDRQLEFYAEIPYTTI
ncbi:hypothetical protein [Streptomyces beijiangensis]|uniref:Uncharacterized protein n=1 Tax=Streptomyces beijiangensis TaxID=163361 RepID=A0A939FAE3_9ACTN|nr:hypothetical protein [Streptomyces beijiangensis]MBO0515586.1 hypothetical protein [Streptomyces beijiangensis]